MAAVSCTGDELGQSLTSEWEWSLVEGAAKGIVPFDPCLVGLGRGGG